MLRRNGTQMMLSAVESLKVQTLNYTCTAGAFVSAFLSKCCPKPAWLMFSRSHICCLSYSTASALYKGSSRHRFESKDMLRAVSETFCRRPVDHVHLSRVHFLPYLSPYPDRCIHVQTRANSAVSAFVKQHDCNESRDSIQS